MTDDRKYPNIPGWKGSKSTGREAAFAIAKKLPTRHAQVMAAIDRYGPAGATCDDIAPQLGLPIHVVRPRASELEVKGKLFAIGKREGAMGHLVTVYTTTKPENDQQDLAA
jgi:predicted Rossmann fold nucleotide-binding protein DprA/Smf involved in DNA uptake